MTDTTNQLKWRAHPARSRPMAAIATLCVVVAIAVLCAFAGGNFWWGVGGGLIMILALNRFFFPSRFSIDEEEITASYLLRTDRIQFKHIRRIARDDRCIYFSTRSVATRWDAFRGVHALFGDHREEVLGLVEQIMAERKTQSEDDES